MTYDTSTLLGSLDECADRMANNLTAKGVTASFNEDLLTLADKINTFDLWTYQSDGSSNYFLRNLSVIPSNHEITVKFNTLNTSQIQIAIANINAYWNYAVDFYSNKFTIAYYTRTTSGSNTTKNVTSSNTTSNEFKIRYEDTTLTIYKDDTLVTTMDAKRYISTDFYFRVYPASTLTKVDYLKVKSL